MFIRILPTTLLQIFCENLLYFQVIFKSVKIADDTFLGNSECEWVNKLPEAGEGQTSGRSNPHYSSGKTPFLSHNFVCISKCFEM